MKLYKLGTTAIEKQNKSTKGAESALVPKVLQIIMQMNFLNNSSYLAYLVIQFCVYKEINDDSSAPIYVLERAGRILCP